MEYRRVLLICVIFLACVAAQRKSDRPKKVADGKIVNGKNTKIHEVPYQVALISPSGRPFCGGTIVDREYIVTAAHCVIDLTTRNFLVRVGSTFGSSGGTVIPVSKIIVHPNYSTTTFEYDAAVLKLNGRIRLDGSTTSTIRLARSPPPVGGMGTISGWGLNHEDGVKGMEILQSASVPFISNLDCQRVFGSRITNRHICAGYTKGGIDACQGDSGGPIAYNNELVGIVSYGNGCARANMPGIYASIADSTIYNFIARNVPGIL